MGIGDWLRRMLHSSEPGVPCQLCRCDIPAADLKKGAAVVIAGRQFCRGCVEEITRRGASRNLPGWTLADAGSSSTIFLA